MSSPHPFSRIFSLFSTHASPAPADMRTIPCTGLDLATRDIVLTTGLIINARLDAKNLEQSLSTLIERKFPRAGARVAIRNRAYEFHIPRTFDAHTLPVAFTAEDYLEPYRSAARPELPVHLPDSFDASQPSFHPLPALEGYFKSRKCPTALEGFLVPNTPLLHVHVAVFTDLTFIGVTSSHITLDALGTRTLLHAWTRLLSGEDIDTIPGMEWNVAPFETFTGPTTVTGIRGWFDLGLFSQLLFIIRLVLRLFRDPKETTHIVRMPKVFLDEAKREIMENLKLQGSSEWVGSSDVLMAWWFKTAYGNRKSDDTTPIHIHLPVDLRGKQVFPGASTLGTPYIHNAISALPVPPIPANAFRTESLGELALRMRRAITTYNADLDGIRADVHWRCANPLKVLFPCPPRGEFSVQSSWRSAHFGQLDFSGACVPRGGKARVVLALGLLSSGQNIPLRGGGGILMEDDDAVWMGQFRGAKEWADLRRSGSVAFI
ncbi:hypothetical protein C8R44DRAFT_884774 [Mycena epipterygia]|nr:hypothetical protein C8R44DRAFT_884774 [Mycena epipterygia]